jgi:hypothetical protein
VSVVKGGDEGRGFCFLVWCEDGKVGYARVQAWLSVALWQRSLQSSLIVT